MSAFAFDLSTATLDIPKNIAYGLVRGTGNLVFQQQLADKTRIAFYLLGEGPWDSILRLWVNSAPTHPTESTMVHFHPGFDGETGFGMGAVSIGGDQHVDAFFADAGITVDFVTYSRYAWLALKIPPDPAAPSPNLTVLADYKALRVRVFDASGNQTSFGWSQNPAWWILDFILRKFILREAKTGQPLAALEKARIDFQSFVNAASYYDASIGTGAAANVTQELFADSFNRADSGTLGASWTTVAGAADLKIVSKQVQRTSQANDNMELYTAAVLPNDQYAEMRVAKQTALAAPYAMVVVRGATGAKTMYGGGFFGIIGGAVLLSIRKIVAGVVTELATAAGTVNPGDIIRLEILGTTLRLTVNGATGGALLTATDASIASGAPGIWIQPNSAATDLALDDWAAGSVVAGSTGIKRFSDGGAIFIQDGITAQQALEQMLLMTRSYTLERNGKISLYADQPRASVFIFNSDNVQPNSFLPKKSSLRSAQNRIIATFRNLAQATGQSDFTTAFAIATQQVDHEAHQRAVGVRGPGLSVIHKIQELKLDLGVNTMERAWRVCEAKLVRQLGDDVDVNLIYSAPWQCELIGYEDSLALEPADLFTIDPSLSEEHGGRIFEAFEIEERPDGTRKIAALEYMPNAFPDVAPSQQGLQATSPGQGLASPDGVDSAGKQFVPLDNTVDGLRRYAPLVGAGLLPADLPYNGGFEVFPDSASVADGWTPSFEAGLAGDGTYSRSVSPFSGTYAQELTASGQQAAVIASRPMAVKPNARYTFRARAKAAVNLTGAFFFRILWYANDADLSRFGGSFVSYNDIAANVAVSSAYTLYSGEILAPAGAAFCRIAFYNYQPGTASTLTIDTVSMQQSTLSLADGVIGGTVDNLPDGATYGRPLLARLSAGNPLIDFAAGYHVNKNINNVADGATRFAATSASLSYRPTSNPITGHDAGASATINIASAVLRVAGKPDVALNSGSISGLAYNTGYYVYYDDPTLAGGAVTYVATTSKETALASAGRIFLGSMMTPKAAAQDTTGNNDGGTGAQSGSLTIATPTQTALSAGFTGSVSGGASAFDRNFSTSTLVQDDSASVTPSGMDWFGFIQQSGIPTSVVLKIYSSADKTSTTGTMLLRYSTDGGATWTTIRSAGWALTLDAVTIPITTAIQNIRVQATATWGSGAGYARVLVYEIWLEVQS